MLQCVDTALPRLASRQVLNHFQAADSPKPFTFLLFMPRQSFFYLTFRCTLNEKVYHVYILDPVARPWTGCPWNGGRVYSGQLFRSSGTPL